MDVETIKAIVTRAALLLLKHQPSLSKFTSETDQSEWNIAHHYAFELARFFPDHDCDFDVIKPNLGYRRPDIIIHKRGTHAHNHLVVEVKRDPADAGADLDKIRRWWFPEPLRYDFGAVVVIDNDELLFVDVVQNE